MDRKQLKLKKFDQDGTIHGTLWKSTGFGSSLMNTLPESYDNNQPMMDVFEAKYPELDDLPQTDYSTLWNAIKFVINSNDDDFSNHVDEYFDLPVIQDYYYRRIAFLDKHFQYEDDTFISNTTYQSDNPNIYSLFGQRINNLNQCKSNIYIINRKKVFIK